MGVGGVESAAVAWVGLVGARAEGVLVPTIHVSVVHSTLAMATECLEVMCRAREIAVATP
jgi:hypothetical protein